MNMELWNDAWEEIQPEISSSGIESDSNNISVSEYLQEIGPMPDEALLMGRVKDGLPLMLNLHDPLPGPILMVSDFENDFLASIAVASSFVSKLSFGIVTHRTSYWEQFYGLNGLVGIFPVYEKSSEDFILSMASWAHGNKISKESVLLLFDELENISHMEMEPVQNLRWLLSRGPARRVWTITTMYSNSENIAAWKDGFRTQFKGISKTKFTFTEDGKQQEARILEPR